METGRNEMNCSAPIPGNRGLPSFAVSTVADLTPSLGAPSPKPGLLLPRSSCPISLFPATSEISFHQLHKQTGNRIKYKKVDSETGREVEADDIINGYEVSKGEYIELEPEELEAVALESKRVIEIDEFVPKADIDELYLNNPY